MFPESIKMKIPSCPLQKYPVQKYPDAVPWRRPPSVKSPQEGSKWHGEKNRQRKVLYPEEDILCRKSQGKKRVTWRKKQMKKPSCQATTLADAPGRSMTRTIRYASTLQLIQEWGLAAKPCMLHWCHWPEQANASRVVCDQKQLSTKM